MRSFFINMGETGDNTKLCVTHTSAGTWTNPIQWNTGFTPNLNTWYHIAVVYDALNFDGVDDRVQIPNTINAAIGNLITIEGWFNLTGGSTPAMLIGESFQGDNKIKFCLVNNGGNNIFAGFFDGGSFGWRQTPTVAIPGATWTHIAATFDQINIRIAPITSMTLKNNGIVSSSHITANYNIFKRASNAYGASWGISLGNPATINVGTNTNMTFNASNNITSFSSILVGRSIALPVEKLELTEASIIWIQD